MQVMDKQDFIEKFQFDQAEYKNKKISSTYKKSSSALPFKEETYLDIINLFREEFGDKVSIEKNKDVNLVFGDDIYNVKIIAKRIRVTI